MTVTDTISKIKSAIEALPSKWQLSRLATAYLATFGALLLFAAVVTLMGSARDGSPVATLTLAQFAEATDDKPMLTRKTRAANGHLIADLALLEQGPGGALPIIGADGRKPVDAYAMPFDAKDKRPRIALVMRGLGVGTMATGAVLSELPPAVTLAFNPYVENAQRFVDLARSSGHEVLVELPMEPFDFPDSDPGPRTLLAAAGVEENSARLYWALSRFTGYVGATNFLGGRFLGEAHALEPVLTTLAQRGLLFFDGGASPRSAAGQIADAKGLAFANAAFVIDSVQSAEDIDAKLAELEIRAQETGGVVALGSPYPITIERVAAWAASLSGRGYTLAPISALVKTQRPTIVKASAE